MASHSERIKLHEKLDKERTEKLRTMMNRLTSKPFDVSIVHDEDAIKRERWLIHHDVQFATDSYWSFVKANFVDDARDYGVKIIELKKLPNYAPTDLYQNTKLRLKMYHALQHPKLFNVRTMFKTSDQKIYIFVDLAGHSIPMSTVAESSRSDSRAKMWTKALANVLAFLHSEGIAFGHNLTVDNIFLDKNHAIKLIGLDLYHRGYETSGRKLMCKFDHSGSQYSAPEVFAASHDELVADIFRFGVIVYYAMTGSYPFEADSDASKLREQISRKSWSNGKVTSDSCKDLLGKMFEPDVTMRITADEVSKHRWIRKS